MPDSARSRAEAFLRDGSQEDRASTSFQDVEYSRNGVCLLCGDGVLSSGEHIDPDRHAQEVEKITSNPKEPNHE